MEQGIMMDELFCSILFHPEDMLRAMLFGVSSRTVLVASWGAWLDGWAWWVSLRQDQVLMHEIYWNMGSPVLSSCIMYTGIHNHISHVSHVSHKDPEWLTFTRFNWLNDFSVCEQDLFATNWSKLPTVERQGASGNCARPRERCCNGTVSVVKY